MDTSEHITASANTFTINLSCIINEEFVLALR
jgi:hypothetical protein